MSGTGGRAMTTKWQADWQIRDLHERLAKERDTGLWFVTGFDQEPGDEHMWTWGEGNTKAAACLDAESRARRNGYDTDDWTFKVWPPRMN